MSSLKTKPKSSKNNKLSQRIGSNRIDNSSSVAQKISNPKIFSKQLLAREMASLLKKIANPTRLLILCHIIKKPKNVSEILLDVNISQSALSQHLSILKENKIISDNKSGKYVYYSINDPKTKKILGFLTNLCQKNNNN